MLESRLGPSIALGCFTAWAGRDAMLATGMKKINSGAFGATIYMGGSY